MSKIELHALPISPFEDDWLYLYVKAIIVYKLQKMFQSTTLLLAGLVYYGLGASLLGASPVAALIFLFGVLVIYFCM